MDRLLSNDLAAGLSERESPLPLASPGKVRPADLGAIVRWVRERFRASTWRVQVPGVHPGSGLTYDDLLDMAHQAENCSYMGEIDVALDDSGKFYAWQRAMGNHFEAIRLIDRLIHRLSAGD